MLKKNNQKERTKLKTLINLLTIVGESTGHTDMSVHQLKILLYVALRDAQEYPTDGQEIAKELGLSSSGVSRAIASLGEYGRHSKPGLGLLEAKPDLVDRRRKPIYLTRRGLTAITKIVEAI